MNRERFVASRKARWEELEQLLRRARGSGLRRLSGDEVLRLGELYRAITSDLAIARRDFRDDRITLYLNGLAGRTHPLVYQERAIGWRRIGHFVRYGFPAAWRDASPYIALAFGLFVAAAVVSAALVTWRQSMADVLLPGQAGKLRSFMEHHQLWVKGATANSPVAANFIMVNNIQVAFIAFAGGIAFGLGPVVEMVQNGIMLGAVGAMIAHYDLNGPFWSFVVPHGVIELSVVFMAGGAGLMMGDALLRPGLRRRRDALPDAAARALRLLGGCVPLLIIAGTIEGFFSPSDAPEPAKFTVGAVSGAVLYAYLLLSRPEVRVTRYTFEDVQTAPRELPAYQKTGPANVRNRG